MRSNTVHLPKIAVLTSIIVTNIKAIYQRGVVVLFDEKRTRNRDQRRGGVALFDEKRTKYRDQERESIIPGSVYY